MSQTYRIKVKQTVKDTVKIGKEWRQKVEMLSLLPQVEMGELLGKFLEEEGWESEDGLMKSQRDKWKLEYDPLSSQMKITYDDEEEVSMTFDEEVDSYDYLDNEENAARSAKVRVEENLKDRVKLEADKRSKEMEGELEEVQKGFFEELELELRDLTEKVQVEALKRKARSIGQVESITEDQASGEVKIRVKL